MKYADAQRIAAERGEVIVTSSGPLTVGSTVDVVKGAHSSSPTPYRVYVKQEISEAEAGFTGSSVRLFYYRAEVLD